MVMRQADLTDLKVRLYDSPLRFDMRDRRAANDVMFAFCILHFALRIT